ncbi:MAG TPA: hypothetical protein VF258_01575 [Luteolibacter sp.]
MKLTPEDPGLTAYILGELGPEDAAAVETAVAADPTLQAEIHRIREIQQNLTSGLARSRETLLPAQRDAILQAARAGKITPLSSFTSALKPWIIPAAAAAVLILTTVILLRMPSDDPGKTADKSLAPAQPGPPTAEPPAPPAPKPPAALSVPHHALAAADFPKLDLPVITTKTNLETVSRSIRIDEKFPPPASVRLEEILNHFPLRLKGITAISRNAALTWHPDTRNGGGSVHVATLSSELIACPWKPSASLLLISLKGNARTDSDVRISFHANPATVLRYRLLGFTPTGESTGGALPAKLGASATTNLAIEIEPSANGSALGTIEWITNDQPAPAIALVREPDAEPSDDARFAALVCTFSQWLAGDLKGIIDADIVSALARELAASDLPADRADFLSLIDKSLHLPQ